MNKFSLHRVFSSMNLFIKANGKQKEIAKRECGLVYGGALAIKPPRAEENVSIRSLPSNTYAFVFGGTSIKRPRNKKPICKLSINNCALVSGGLPIKPPREMIAGACAFPLFHQG